MSSLFASVSRSVYQCTQHTFPVGRVNALLFHQSLEFHFSSRNNRPNLFSTNNQPPLQPQPATPYQPPEASESTPSGTFSTDFGTACSDVTIGNSSSKPSDPIVSDTEFTRSGGWSAECPVSSPCTGSDIPIDHLEFLWFLHVGA